MQPTVLAASTLDQSDYEVTLVDCPGFDNTGVADITILEQLAEFLSGYGDREGQLPDRHPIPAPDH